MEEQICQSRRGLIKAAVAGGALAGAGALPQTAAARGNMEMPPEALGLLFDATLCVGCKACVAACKRENGATGAAAEFTTTDQPYWDTPLDTTAKTFNIIKMYRNGTAENMVKDREQDGYAFMKFSCLHCVDPSCISACPVSAMSKDTKTGIVSYNKDACIGCRYCVAACPFGIPKWDFNDPFGKIGKCELCRHRIPDGKYSACAEVCPTGATLYGKVTDLMAEAKRRIALKPGTTTRWPRGSINGPDNSWEGEVPTYVKRVYGETEIGGTQMLKLSAVPFDKLGMPDLPKRSPASNSETIQHTMYGNFLALPIAAVATLAYLIKRNQKDDTSAKTEGEQQ